MNYYNCIYATYLTFHRERAMFNYLISSDYDEKKKVNIKLHLDELKNCDIESAS